MNSLKLNLGCGTDIRDGYMNIDKYRVTDRVTCADIADLGDLVEKETVDEIFAKDVLEHISHRKIDHVLKHWSSLLKVGGKIIIQVPDITKQIECLQNGLWDIDLFSYMVFGGQEYDGNYHAVSFTPQSISEKMEKAGLRVTHIECVHHGLTNNIATSNNANMIVYGEKI